MTFDPKPTSAEADALAALRALMAVLPSVFDAADIEPADTVFTVRAKTPDGNSRDLAQRSLQDLMDAATAAIAKAESA